MKSESVEVDIPDRQICRLAVDLVKQKVTPSDICSGSYINEKGNWEHWEGGYDSGYTSEYREATAKEVAEFQIILDFESLIVK